MKISFLDRPQASRPLVEIDFQSPAEILRWLSEWPGDRPLYFAVWRPPAPKPFLILRQARHDAALGRTGNFFAVVRAGPCSTERAETIWHMCLDRIEQPKMFDVHDANGNLIWPAAEFKKPAPPGKRPMNSRRNARVAATEKQIATIKNLLSELRGLNNLGIYQIADTGIPPRLTARQASTWIEQLLERRWTRADPDAEADKNGP